MDGGNIKMLYMVNNDFYEPFQNGLMLNQRFDFHY